MKAGPSKSASKERASNHLKLLRSRVVVVSIEGKRGARLPVVWIRETNESEPPMTRRNGVKRRQNQGCQVALGQACQEPGDWASGDRRGGGVNRVQASVRNCRNQSLRCEGRSPSGQNHEARVPMRGTGTDRPVRAKKAGNAAGAKGSGQAAATMSSTGDRRRPAGAAKPFDIPKQLFCEAFAAVKANAGAAGVDKQSIEDFERNLQDNLYKLWNRMSSGSYFPPPVKCVFRRSRSGVPAEADHLFHLMPIARSGDADQPTLRRSEATLALS